MKRDVMERSRYLISFQTRDQILAKLHRWHYQIVEMCIVLSIRRNVGSLDAPIMKASECLIIHVPCGHSVDLYKVKALQLAIQKSSHELTRKI